ncbi:MAG: outer rane efflux protein, partial [Labilithrix sp.]|nr:outer rane efflux protein [Labilithrix sp.]
MRSFGVLFASMYANPGGSTRKSLALTTGAVVLVVASFAQTAHAQAPAGATGAAPGTAPNAPPPPAAPAPTGTPDVARAPAGGEMPSGTAGALSAENVGQRSMATSYQAKAAEQNLTAAGARADQQWTNFLPRIGLVARYTRLSDFTPPSITGGGSLVGTPAAPGTLNPTPTAALGGFSFPLVLDNYLTQATIAIPISDYFLRIGQAYSAATRSEDAARYDVVAARARSYADGKVAFYTWLRARGAVGVAEQSLAVARAHLKDAENQFAVGNASKADVLRAQTQVAAAELAVERAKSGVAITERQVRVAIHGKDEELLVPGESLDGPVPPAPTNLRSLVAEAHAARPEIKSIDKSAESARKLADVARGGKYPALSGFGDLTYANPNQRRFPQQSEWFPTWSLGAQITWSPNDVIAAGAAGSDAEARASALDAQKQATRDGIELEVTQAYQGIVEGDAAITSTQRQLESAVEGYRVARELFNNGRGTATTLID